jgi:hypothetical protein
MLTGKNRISRYSDGYRMDGQGSISGKGERFLSFPQHSDRLWGLPIELVPGTLSRGFKREAEHSCPTSDEVKNGGALPPLPAHVFMPWWLVK